MKNLTITVAMLAMCAAGCDADEPKDDDADVATDPVPGEWLRLTADMTWQWQIEGELNASYDVDVYDIDAFENSAETIAQLHEQGRTVICYFSAGSYEPWQADADAYDPLDIGQPLADWPDERWVDVRSARVREIIAARMDVAAQKGCDGVEPDNVTAWRNESGFDIGADDQIDFNRWLAAEAHARGMAVALKNDGDQAAELADAFDFSVNEECHAYDECEQLAPFLDAGKPVFNAEYAESASEAEALSATLCSRAHAANTRTIILPWDLDDTFRVSCD